MPASGSLSLGGIQYEIFAVDKTKEAVESAKKGVDEVGVHYDTALTDIAFKFNMIKDAATGAFSLIIEGFNKTVGGAMSFADQLDYASDVTGISVEKLQRLRAGGIAVGASFDSITYSIKMFSQKVDDSGISGDNFRKRLEHLGVSIKDSNGNIKDQYTLYMDTMKALSGITDVTERNASAQAIYGRSWANQASIMKNYAEFSKAAEEAEPISEDKIDKAHRLEIEMSKINEKAHMAGVEIGMTLLPATEEWFNLIEGATKGDSPLIGFFTWLNDALVRAAQGFHIIGESVKWIERMTLGDLKGAAKIETDMNKWMADQQYEDSMRKSGFYKNKSGQWVNPDVSQPSAPGAPVAPEADELSKEAQEAEKERVTALTSAYKEYTSELEKMNDLKRKNAEEEGEYLRNVQFAGNDIAAIRRLTVARESQKRRTAGEMSSAEGALQEDYSRFGMIATGKPLESVPGTSQYDTAQAKKAGDLIIQIGGKEVLKVENAIASTSDMLKIMRIQKGGRTSS